MARLTNSKPSSLERLKALDSLPNLNSQLEDIKQLCTHAARAEMIARWLSSKLQSNAEAKQSVEAWDAFHSTLRMLSPDRIAPTLGGPKVLKTLQEALEETGPNEALLHSFKRILLFFLEQGETSPGVAVKAVLSLPAAEAAQFAGQWLRACLAILEAHQGTPKLNACDIILPALRIWELRRRSSQENEVFAQYCLGACAALLNIMGSAQLEASQRKRFHDERTARPSAKSAIQSLLARHVFLPGRAAFFKVRGTSNMRNVGSQQPSYVLESLLAPLGKASHGSKSPSVSPLPQLLDLALRSTPAPSPTQRIQEKPWIEMLFLSLLDLNKIPDGQLANAEALSGMLRVLAKRSHTLSEGVLEDFALKDAGLGQEFVGSIDWDLVAAVVEVNAALFKDTKMAHVLFDAITKASIKMGEDVAQSDADAPDEAMHTLWRDGIIVPVFEAFARYNDLSTAIEMCAQQLQHDLHGTFWSPWNHLDEPIQSLLEESLSNDQILSVCQRSCSRITQFNDHRPTEDMQVLGAAIVMLNALLGGIHHEQTLEKLQPDLERTFKAFMELHGAHVGPGLIPVLQERRCWSLMTTIFELWFSSWAAQKQDASSVVANITALVPRSVLDRAAGLSSTVHQEEYGSVEDSKSASDAKCFVACVCSHVLANKHAVGEDALLPFIEVINGLGSAYALDAAHEKLSFDAFVLYPEVLAFMDAETRLALLQRYVQRANLRHSECARLHVGALNTLVSAAASSAQSQVIDDLITATLISLQGDRVPAKKDSSVGATIVAEVFCEVPARTLTRQQREKILDYITGSLSEDRAAYGKALPSCLPLMLRLMELPNPTARLCLEPDVLSTMAKDLEIILERGSGDRGTLVEYFEGLVSLVLQQCIRTKDQERSVKMVVGLSAEAAKIMKTIRSTGVQVQTLQFALVKVILSQLEPDSTGDLKAQMPHRKASTVKKLASGLASAISNGLQPDLNSDVLPSLDLLSAAPPALIAASGFDLAGLLASLATFLEASLGPRQTDTLQQLDGIPSGLSKTTVMVRCYQTLGRFAPSAANVRLCMFADRLLQLALEPREHATVLLTFEALLANLGSSRTALVEELLRGGPSMPASRLLPLQLSIGKLDKHDFDTPEDFPPTAILHRLLMIVSGSNNFTVTRRALACVADVLKMKLFMINQYNIEVTLRVLQQLVQQNGAVKNTLYLDICSTITALLLHHRPRLQGRFHMVIKLLQALMTRLFEPLHGWDKATARRPLTAEHAQALSRLLKSFCEPPQLRRSQQVPGLVDESRKEQAHVGTFVQHVLHHYCAQILHGALADGMKDALTPGLQAIIEAMEMNGAEGGKALSAAMSNSERAVLRGLYEEWRRFGKWKGG